MKYSINAETESRVEEIAVALANGGKRKEINKIFAEKWGINMKSIDRYLTLARERAMEIQQAARDANTTAFEDAAIASVKGLIKTKSQRIMDLQRQVDEATADLIHNKTSFPVKDSKVEGGYKMVVRPLNMAEKGALRRIIAQITSLISDLQGDFPRGITSDLHPIDDAEIKQSMVVFIPNNGRSNN